MSDYSSDSNPSYIGYPSSNTSDDVNDHDSELSYLFGDRSEESYHSSEFPYSISDHLFSERKKRAPVEAGEEVNQVVHLVDNQTANLPENQPDSPILIPIYIISSDEEVEDDIPVPEKSELHPLCRDVQKRRVEKIKRGFEQQRSYLDNRQDRDMMAPCPDVAPYMPPSKKHRRSFSF